MKRHQPERAPAQRRMRKRKNEHAYLFTSEGHLLAEVDCDTWEFAIAVARGDVASAAETCGLGAISGGGMEQLPSLAKPPASILSIVVLL